MSEEDEIRDAVVALLEAQERGEDISELLPTTDGAAEPGGLSADGTPMGDVDTEGSGDSEQARADAVARALRHVRTCSRASRLLTADDWVAAGLVPAFMGAEDLEMAVYDRLTAYGKACDLDESLGKRGLTDHGELPSDGADDAESAGFSSAARRPMRRNPHATSAFSSSPGRPVGLSGFKRRPNAHAEAVDDAGQATRAGDAATETVSAAAPSDPAAEFADCQGIRMLMGATTYYLYDGSLMTDAFARWAFLAAEDDPVATFVECVRDESRIYPRPLALTNLANPPFRMDADAVEAAFRQAREQGRAADIERIQASNGAVYFYSTDHLGSAQARSLAEYDAVERAFSV